jgi:hypothetical protein
VIVARVGCAELVVEAPEAGGTFGGVAGIESKDKIEKGPTDGRIVEIENLIIESLAEDGAQD